jgi:hypothetical protein
MSRWTRMLESFRTIVRTLPVPNDPGTVPFGRFGQYAVQREDLYYSYPAVFGHRGSHMADLERRVSTLEDQMAHVVATLDVLATNQNHLDEALATLADAQIRTQEQFRETDARISNLTSAIGQLIAEMRSKAN